MKSLLFIGIFLWSLSDAYATDAAMIAGRVRATEILNQKTTASLWRQYWTEELELQRHISRFLGTNDRFGYGERTMTLTEALDEARFKAEWAQEQLVALRRSDKDRLATYIEGKAITLTRKDLMKMGVEYSRLLSMKDDFLARYANSPKDFQAVSNDLVYANRAKVWAGGSRIQNHETVFSGPAGDVEMRLKLVKYRASNQLVPKKVGNWKVFLVTSLGLAAVTTVNASDFSAGQAAPQRYDSRVSVEESTEE
jgi:hypothetical protein